MSKRVLKYGDKRDYPKIAVCVDGQYFGTTTWARTCKEAVAKAKEAQPHLSGSKITAHFQKDR